MATLREIVTHLQNTLAAGRRTDDTRFSDRQWAFVVDYHRAQIIRQQKEKGQYVAEENVQDLGTLKLAKQSCGKWKADKPIPRTIELYREHLLYVTSPNGLSWQQTTAQSAQWDSFAKHTGKREKWYLLGADLWGIHPSSVASVNVRLRGVFENPREALVFTNTLPVYDELDFTYPLSATGLDTLYKMAADGTLRLLTMVKPDTTNNASEDPQA